MEKAPEGLESVLPTVLKLKLPCCVPHSCEAAFRTPGCRCSLPCQTATLLPLARAGVSGRWFSELSGKQISLADKYR